MPVHRASSLDGNNALADLLKQVERSGETVISVLDHANEWVVITQPKQQRRPAAKNKEYRSKDGSVSTTAFG